MLRFRGFDVKEIRARLDEVIANNSRSSANSTTQIAPPLPLAASSSLPRSSASPPPPPPLVASGSTDSTATDINDPPLLAFATSLQPGISPFLVSSPSGVESPVETSSDQPAIPLSPSVRRVQELLHDFGSWEFSEHILLALLVAAQELPNAAVGVLLQMKSTKHVNDLRIWLANTLKVLLLSFSLPELCFNG